MAVVVAAAALALLLLGMVGLGGLFVARAVASDHLGDRGDRGPVMQGGWRGDRDAPVPPGLQGRRDGQPRQRGGVDPGPGADGLAPLLRSALALGAVQHGEFTVTGTDGKATVMTVQRGTVTAVGSSSVAVRSSDGYSATYARDDATRGGANVAKGDSVLVIARKEGATALVVRELRAR